MNLYPPFNNNNNNINKNMSTLATHVFAGGNYDPNGRRSMLKVDYLKHKPLVNLYEMLQEAIYHTDNGALKNDSQVSVVWRDWFIDAYLFAKLYEGVNPPPNVPWPQPEKYAPPFSEEFQEKLKAKDALKQGSILPNDSMQTSSATGQMPVPYTQMPQSQMPQSQMPQSQMPAPARPVSPVHVPFFPASSMSMSSVAVPTQPSVAAPRQGYFNQPQSATQSSQLVSGTSLTSLPGMMPSQSGNKQAGSEKQPPSFLEHFGRLSLRDPLQNHPTSGQQPAGSQIVKSTLYGSTPWGNTTKMPPQIPTPEPPRPLTLPLGSAQVNPALGRTGQKPSSKAAPAERFYKMPQELAKELWEHYYTDVPLFYGCGYFEVPVHPQVAFKEMVTDHISVIQKYMDPNYVHLVFGDRFHTKDNKRHLGRKLIISFINDKVEKDRLAHERLVVNWDVVRWWYESTFDYFEHPSPDKKLYNLLEACVFSSNCRVDNYLGESRREFIDSVVRLNREAKTVAMEKAEKRRIEQEAQEAQEKLEEETDSKKKEHATEDKKPVSEQKDPLAIIEKEKRAAFKEAEATVSALVTATSDFDKQKDAVNHWISDLTRNAGIPSGERKAFAATVWMKHGDLRPSKQKEVETKYLTIPPSASMNPKNILSINMETDNFNRLDLRQRSNHIYTNTLLQKIWPRTADWPGLSALVVIIRQIYSMMPLDLQSKQECLEEEKKNPIRELAWMDLSGVVEPQYSSLYQGILQMLHSDRRKPLPTLLELFNSDIMMDTLWSREEFLLYDRAVLARPALAGEEGKWERRRTNNIRFLARNSIVEYDGSENLSDVIANKFGTFVDDDNNGDSSGDNFLRLFNHPLYIRVHYKPSSSDDVLTPRFKDLLTIAFETEKMEHHGDDKCRLVTEPQRYALIATVRLDPENLGKDFVRLYNLDGRYIFLPQSPGGFSLVSPSWQVGVPSQEYLLIYARTSSRADIFLHKIKEVAEVQFIDPRISEYQEVINSLGGDQTIGDTTSASSVETANILSSIRLQSYTTAGIAATSMSLAPTPSLAQPDPVLSLSNPQLSAAGLDYGSNPVYQDTRPSIPAAPQLPSHESTGPYDLHTPVPNQSITGQPLAPSTLGGFRGPPGANIPSMSKSSRQKRRRGRDSGFNRPPKPSEYNNTPTGLMNPASEEDDMEDEEQDYSLNTRIDPRAKPQQHLQQRRQGQMEQWPRSEAGEDPSRDYQYSDLNVRPRTGPQLAPSTRDHGESINTLNRGDETHTSRKRTGPSDTRGDGGSIKKNRWNKPLSSTNTVPLGQRPRKDTSDSQAQSQQKPS